MAVEISDGAGTPHAVDYSDLLTKLKTFALANGWTSLEDTSDKLVLQGEGLDGDDEIIVAIQKYASVGTDSFGWRLQGYTGYQDDGSLFNDQPGHVPGFQIAVPLWNDEIPYWFIVSPRRIIVIAKVSTTYQMAYLGFYLPFASPHQYPYPLAIGGAYLDNTTSTPRFSATGNQSSNFWTAPVNGLQKGTLFARLAGGIWFSQNNSASSSSQTSSGMYPYNQEDILLMRQALDDEPVVTPVEIHQNITTPIQDIGRLGEIDGVFHISGFSQSAEDVVTIDGDDYVVVPNISRSGSADYAAIKLV